MYKYFTTVEKENVRGGWSALNNKIYHGLADKLDIDYVNIDYIPALFFEAFLSRVMRFLGLRGKYFFYSKRRLKKINKEVNSNLSEGDIPIFFGCTPWIGIEGLTKYYVITDISFLGYYKNYNEDKFDQDDIARIAKTESKFLSRASSVFLTSDWAKDMITNEYKIPRANMINIGIAGNIEGYLCNVLSDNIELLFIANNFTVKGGEVMFEAFLFLLKKHTNIKLNIIGDSPRAHILEHQEVKFHGFLNKSKAEDLKKYISLLSTSSLLVTPTKSDAAPLTILECGYFGTPCIAPDNFAIPELVVDETTGYLLHKDFNSKDLANKIDKFINLSSIEKSKMRKLTFDYNQKKNWQTMISIIYKEITKSQSIYPLA
jgi:glycosyltransferase involved in cell wall biosynthesis